MSKASETRFGAIRAVTETFVNAENDFEVRADTNRDSVAERIESLRPLGRTDRWHGALDTWRAWVLDPETDLRWAIVQGSIGAGHAAS